MNIQFMFENKKGSVVDKYGRSEPMNYIVDEEQFRLETLISHTKYNPSALKSEKEIGTMQVEKEVKCLSAATAAKQLGTHVRTAQKWAKQYETDPDWIFEKRRKTGRLCILHEEHKNAIIECIDGNPSVVLDELMKKLKQTFTELKVSKTTFFDFVKQHCNLSLKKARLQPMGQHVVHHTLPAIYANHSPSTLIRPISLLFPGPASSCPSPLRSLLQASAHLRTSSSGSFLTLKTNDVLAEHGRLRIRRYQKAISAENMQYTLWLHHLLESQAQLTDTSMPDPLDLSPLTKDIIIGKTSLYKASSSDFRSHIQPHSLTTNLSRAAWIRFWKLKNSS
ncbi:hypothetical protein F4703DRAFT_1928519 [Phycomyces blakesleeanus]